MRWPKTNTWEPDDREWEAYSDGAGSITESGCCESQFPKNSHNMYATAREGECGAETVF